ncbi:MAG: hypothetical protein ABIP64_02590 [Burkholderiales bacterium]
MKIYFCILVAIILPLIAFSSNAADPGRGRALYETQCMECHDVSVHGRKNRDAKNYEDIRKWVARWNRNLGGYWGKEEIEDVTDYLNERYYSFPCTGLEC